MNSNQKGKRAELELANLLKDYGFHDARRSQQYNGIGEGDVVGLNNIHIECKRVEKLNVYKAMEQAEDECKGLVPIVMHRKNNEEWKVTMQLDDWVDFYREWVKFNKQRKIKSK